MPVVQLIAVDHIEYAPVYDQMQSALDAAQMHGDPEIIEIDITNSGKKYLKFIEKNTN